MDSLIRTENWTEREEQLINAAVERALLLMPEAVQNMIMNTTMTRDMAKKFFDENKSFSGHVDLVQAVIEKTEMDNPGVPYSKILEMATPTIKEKLLTVGKLDYQTPVYKPSPVLEAGDHGAL
jgi:hypothetical protein